MVVSIEINTLGVTESLEATNGLLSTAKGQKYSSRADPETDMSKQDSRGEYNMGILLEKF